MSTSIAVCVWKNLEKNLEGVYVWFSYFCEKKGIDKNKDNIILQEQA